MNNESVNVPIQCQPYYRNIKVPVQAKHRIAEMMRYVDEHGRFTKTIDQQAEELGVSTATISRWRREMRMMMPTIYINNNHAAYADSYSIKNDPIKNDSINNDWLSIKNDRVSVKSDRTEIPLGAHAVILDPRKEILGNRSISPLPPKVASSPDIAYVQHGEHVRLRPNAYARLKEFFGNEDLLKGMIERMNAAITKHGYQFTNYEAQMMQWHNKDTANKASIEQQNRAKEALQGTKFRLAEAQGMVTRVGDKIVEFRPLSDGPGKALRVNLEDHGAVEQIENNLRKITPLLTKAESMKKEPSREEEGNRKLHEKIIEADKQGEIPTTGIEVTKFTVVFKLWNQHLGVEQSAVADSQKADYRSMLKKYMHMLRPPSWLETAIYGEEEANG